MRFRLCPRPPSCPVAGPAGTVFFQGDLGLLVKNKMCLGFTSPAGGREGSWDVTSAVSAINTVGTLDPLYSCAEETPA
jgi:hypothetical protein